eukprot:m.63031 g.63031  ORF g.63031 m.63031 type:complete len:90 (+) comp11427_c0_seq1:992-1261(+)
MCVTNAKYVVCVLQEEAARLKVMKERDEAARKKAEEKLKKQHKELEGIALFREQEMERKAKERQEMQLRDAQVIRSCVCAHVYNFPVNY